jgi:hypothetical protein
MFTRVGEVGFARREGCMLPVGRVGRRGVKSSGLLGDRGIGRTLPIFVCDEPYEYTGMGSPSGAAGRGGELPTGGRSSKISWALLIMSSISVSFHD